MPRERTYYTIAIMVQCRTTYVLLVVVVGANVLFTSWNVADRYRYFDFHRCIEEPPNICNLLEHGSEKELLAKATKCHELRALVSALSLSRGLSKPSQGAAMRGSSLSGAGGKITALSSNQSDNLDKQHNIAVGNGDENNIIPSTDKDLYKNSANKERQYLLSVMVLSSPNENGKERRQVIRETWKRGFEAADSAVAIRFVLGTADLEESQESSLESEHANYSDLLLLPNLKDGYLNLTLKVLNILVWADNHLHFAYLLKCDDDTYIRVEAIVSELKRRKSRQSLYWGYFSGKAKPLARGKWRENNWFLCDNFLPFAMGGGYIISFDLVHRIARSAGGLQLYSNEDTSVGVWLSPYIAERKHDIRFNTEGISRGCSDKHLVSHKQNSTDMRRKYQSLLNSAGRLQCRGEHLIRHTYEYNWHVPPSECCRKRSQVNW